MPSDRLSIVVHTISNHRPAIITPSLDPINFIASARAVLRFENYTRFRMRIQALGIAIPIGPDGGICIRSFDEWVVVIGTALRSVDMLETVLQDPVWRNNYVRVRWGDAG